MMVNWLAGKSSRKTFRKFGGTNTPLVMYVDADFAMDPDQRKSTTGWVSLFFGGPSKIGPQAPGWGPHNQR